MIRIGVDVGGTNTDAVLVEGRRVLRKAKTPTTPDVTTGIRRALDILLGGMDGGAPPADSRGETPGLPAEFRTLSPTLKSGTHPRGAAGAAPYARLASRVHAVMVGTTHFVNALLERRGLARTAVFRLCGPATRLLPPFCDWPGALKEAVCGRGYLLPGGHEFDGREISRFDERAMRDAVGQAVAQGVESVALCGVFSPVNPEHEERAAALIRGAWPHLAVTVSHEIGRIGLLERENAAALNGALAPIARRTIQAVRDALARLGVEAPLFLSQNDGTLMDAAYAARYPVLAISSGPTNSMRGAALLSGVHDALVADVGGTSTDVGALVRGFPREAPLAVEIAGVRTNFRMPDLLSIALGGGSVVGTEPLTIGPHSVGARITEEALVFGGATLTATDLAVAAGRARIGDATHVRHLDPELVRRGMGEIRRRLEAAIDRMKLSPEPAPLVLVGGGSVLIGEALAGISEILRPEHADVANAIGAAIAQVGGTVDGVYSLDQERRQDALEHAKEQARARAADAGADPATVEIVEIEEIPLTYLPGNAVRIRVKAVGELAARRDASGPATP